jgi:hypothetical protein
MLRMFTIRIHSSLKKATMNHLTNEKIIYSKLHINIRMSTYLANKKKS